MGNLWLSRTFEIHENWAIVIFQQFHKSYELLHYQQILIQKHKHEISTKLYYKFQLNPDTVKLLYPEH